MCALVLLIFFNLCLYFFQLTIEHDPDAISRRKPSFPNKTHIIPLTTTSSDTNIPNTKIENKTSSNQSIANDVSNSIENLRSKCNSNINEVTISRQEPVSRDKERLFKRKDEGYMSGTRSRQLKRKNNLCENRQSLDKERSSSMSRLLDE